MLGIAKAPFRRWQSRPHGGRACLDLELMTFVRQISSENPTWGGNRIHAELPRLRTWHLRPELPIAYWG
jgi:hypothetical protein